MPYLSAALSAALSEYADSAADSAVDKDGIPALDGPETTDPEDAESFLVPNSRVFGVELDGEARAYPWRILVWHEIANDTLGGTNVAVTYCPLTGTVIGYERGETTFGVEGRLINSNLICFDRATDSWWPQVLGTCVEGAFEGYSLREFPVTRTTWERWVDAHPETTVVTENTGYVRDYGRDPYGGYGASDSILLPVMVEDDRHHPKETVVGARTADGAVAFLKERLADERLIEGSVGGTPYLCVYGLEHDRGYVYRNPEAVGVEADGERFRVDGERLSAGELPLAPINSFDAMWFAWVAFYPGTERYG
jgi:hypothetical protein